MKQIIYILLLIISIDVYAQPPEAMNYQASLIGAGGVPVSYHSVSVRITLMDSIMTGPVLYQETFSVTTDKYGLFNIEIGKGNPVTGTFSNINWGVNDKWQQTEVDTSGGVNFTLMGNSQMLSVPYALYAKETGGKVAFDRYQGGYLISTNYMAPADGFLIVSRNLNGISCPGIQSAYIYMDSLNVPSSHFADVGMESTTTIPVKKNWHWRIEENPNCTGINSTFRIVWMGLK